MSKKWPTLYSKTATGAINYWTIWTNGSMVCMQWGQFGTERPQADSYEAKGKNIGRKNETSPEEQAVKEAQSMFDKKLRLKYYRTIREAEHELNIKPMLAYTLDEKRQKKIDWPIYVQPKYNGVRCMAYNLPDRSVRLMSRGGKDYTLPHIQKELEGRIPDGWCLDGELYSHGMNLQTIRHNIETYTGTSKEVAYVCYDILQLPPTDMSWEMRYVKLQHWFEENIDVGYVRIADTGLSHSMQAVDTVHNMHVQNGYEGLIARTRDGKYKLGARSKDLLKYKKFFDDEFVVVGWKVGKDGIIIYRCLQEDGLEFEVRPMGTEHERARLLNEAKKRGAPEEKLTVRYQERSSDNIPMYPVGVGFRSRKDMS